MKDITRFLKTNWLFVLITLLIIQFRGRLMTVFDHGFGALVTKSEREKGDDIAMGNIGKEAERLSTTPRIINIANRLEGYLKGFRMFKSKSEIEEIFKIISSLSVDELKATYKAYGKRSLGGSFFDEWFGLRSINLILSLELVIKEKDKTMWSHIEQKLKSAGLI